MSRASIYLSCLIAVFIANTAVATPMSATTSQAWTFDTLTNPTQPEFYNNIYGIPTAELSTTQSPPDYFGWLDIVDGRQGVWTGDPLHITLIIPNQPIPNAYKEIYLEMEFQPTLEWVKVTPSPVDSSVVEEIFRDISPVDSQWKKLTIGWRIEPNPNEEKICMSLTGTGGLVDYITVDSHCIPEPATVALLSMGALVLLTRQRK